MLVEIPAVRNWSALVVDDAPAMRAIMRTLLRGVGISAIKEAGDGSRALEFLEAHRFDIIITDLVMSPMDGLEMTRLIRRPHLRYAFVPIIMVSGQNDENSIKAALNAGVTEFLVKPLTPNAHDKMLSRRIIGDPIADGAQCGLEMIGVRTLSGTRLFCGGLLTMPSPPSPRR